MFRTSLSALALLVAAPAFAGGYVAPPAPPPPPAPPVVQDDWTGFYAGGQVDLILDSTISEGGFDFFELEGHLIGVFAGYRYDLGDFVVGGEVDYMIGTVDSTPLITQATGGEIDVTLIRAGLEAGYDLGDALIYGTGGFANIEIDGAGPTDESNGYFAGIGVDYRVSSSIVVGAELLYHEFSDFDSEPTATLDVTTFGLNVAFTF